MLETSECLAAKHVAKLAIKKNCQEKMLCQQMQKNLQSGETHTMSTHHATLKEADNPITMMLGNKKSK
jgi:hypothetical protein